MAELDLPLTHLDKAIDEAREGTRLSVAAQRKREGLAPALGSLLAILKSIDLSEINTRIHDIESTSNGAAVRFGKAAEEIIEIGTGHRDVAAAYKSAMQARQHAGRDQMHTAGSYVTALRADYDTAYTLLADLVERTATLAGWADAITDPIEQAVVAGADTQEKLKGYRPHLAGE